MNIINILFTIFFIFFMIRCMCLVSIIYAQVIDIVTMKTCHARSLPSTNTSSHVQSSTNFYNMTIPSIIYAFYPLCYNPILLHFLIYEISNYTYVVTCNLVITIHTYGMCINNHHVFCIGHLLKF